MGVPTCKCSLLDSILEDRLDPMLVQHRSEDVCNYEVRIMKEMSLLLEDCHIDQKLFWPLCLHPKELLTKDRPTFVTTVIMKIVLS